MELLSLTRLRAQLYEVVDRVIETGVPQVLERRGHRLRIVLEEPRDKFDNLVPHQSIVGDPGTLVDIKAAEWSEEDL